MRKYILFIYMVCHLLHVYAGNLENKITMNIKVQVLSIDSIPALLRELANNIEGENSKGKLCKDDGDEIAWEYEESKIYI